MWNSGYHGPTQQPPFQPTHPPYGYQPPHSQVIKRIVVSLLKQMLIFSIKQLQIYLSAHLIYILNIICKQI